MPGDAAFEKALGDTPPAPRADNNGKSLPDKSHPAPVRSLRGSSTGGRPSNAQLKAELKTGLEKIGATLTVAGLFNARLAYDAEIIANNIDRLTDELFKVAQRNPAVGRMLHSMFTMSETMESIAVFGAVAVPILANHGVLPTYAAEMVRAPTPPPRKKRKKGEEKVAAGDRTVEPDPAAADDDGDVTTVAPPADLGALATDLATLR